MYPFVRTRRVRAVALDWNGSGREAVRACCDARTTVCKVRAGDHFVPVVAVCVCVGGGGQHTQWERGGCVGMMRPTHINEGERGEEGGGWVPTPCTLAVENVAL